ncbi:MAG: metal-dependent transcriptional regulator [Candidatus Omnitrophica bacterium]|nr:metal-dependent transcriptional regulator [Candidatus Omnitrophota bacterium]MBU4487821.1 metal-dependent transcriptional regulator [Candidatus Omnitrophota bacterium]MCG2705539.1 metal-dependent transcriptional regulator [Candidatus Omnitrophota bacterium]
MEREQKIEEALSIVWEEREKKVGGDAAVRARIYEKLKEDILDDLVKEGYVTVSGTLVKLTGPGEEKAKDIIRRQRLAERLLTDVLELDRREMDYSACEFEHILSKEVEESICTLLGHPVECPHGLAIPAGDCCQKAKDFLESIAVPLSKLKPGESGKVLYILTRKHPQLHKLMSLGILPGVRVFVHQVFPSVVIRAEETQLALEEDVAKEIYVKKS